MHRVVNWFLTDEIPYIQNFFFLLESYNIRNAFLGLSYISLKNFLSPVIKTIRKSHMDWTYITYKQLESSILFKESSLILK